MNNDRLSHGLWEASAPDAPITDSLKEAIDVDVAIIGAGFTGCSAALHLALGGAKVAVIEAQEIGYGGSGRNVGLVNAGLWIPPNDVIKHLGQEYGQRLLDLLGNGPQRVFELVQQYAIDCEAIHNGTLHCAVGSAGYKDLEQRTKQWADLGAPVELLSAEKTHTLVGTRAYEGALLDRRAGTIQPLAYVRGLARAAIGAGAMIYTQTPITHAESEGSCWHLSTANGQRVKAGYIIVATNAYTQFKHPWAIVREQLVHLPYFNLATQILSDELQAQILPEKHGVWDTKTILSSFRFNREGRLVFGSVGALTGLGKKVHHDWGIRALRRLFPQLKNVHFEHQWYGSIGMTHDAIPRFHALAERVYTFTGYNGRGIAPGTVFGETLAKLIQNQLSLNDLPLPVSSPQASAFRSIKEHYYEHGATIAHWAN